MGRYLLDSSTFIRAQKGSSEIRPEAREVMEDRDNTIYISLAALWEMAIKAANGKLPFYSEMIAKGPATLIAGLRETNFTLLGIEIEHALAAANLPQYHRDPFDRLMIAQSMCEQIPIVSADPAFDAYSIKRIW